MLLLIELPEDCCTHEAARTWKEELGPSSFCQKGVAEQEKKPGLLRYRCCKQEEGFTLTGAEGASLTENVHTEQIQTFCVEGWSHFQRVHRV